MSDVEYHAFNLVLAASVGGWGFCELVRPAWLERGAWRDRYPSSLLYARGGAALVAAGLLLRPGMSFAGSWLLLALAMTVATAFLIDGELQLAMVPLFIAVAAGANGYLNVI
ncbi:hypothetical protein [Sphingomonas echinoides]|uniref:hypothetical protein n=1 Tax=Sphingomonas echinoides TaxID=59803 RepID=UPI0024135C06|nr:hypothetical protein [Sphingomonas echinoides]